MSVQECIRLMIFVNHTWNNHDRWHALYIVVKPVCKWDFFCLRPRLEEKKQKIGNGGLGGSDCCNCIKSIIQ